MRTIQDNVDTSDFMGARPDALVRSAEAALGVKFPPSYRRFVTELGAGSIAGEEFYGVTTSDFEVSSVPNGIWLTLTQRKTSGLPKHLVLVYGVGNGQYFALDTSKHSEDGESPLVVWTPGASKAEDELETAAADFGSFFLKTVRRAVGG